MDDDRSGKVTYTEFAELCREELEMSKKKVPDVQLQGAWNALDDDDSGFITAGAARCVACSSAACARRVTAGVAEPAQRRCALCLLSQASLGRS